MCSANIYYVKKCSVTKCIRQTLIWMKRVLHNCGGVSTLSTYSVFVLPLIPLGLQVVFCSPLVCVNVECWWGRMGLWDGWVASEVLYMKFDIFPGLGRLAIGTIYHVSHGSHFRPHYKSNPFRRKLMQFPFTWYTIAVWREMESSAISEVRSWFKNTAEGRDKLWEIRSGFRRHEVIMLYERFI